MPAGKVSSAAALDSSTTADGIPGSTLGDSIWLALGTAREARLLSTSREDFQFMDALSVIAFTTFGYEAKLPLLVHYSGLLASTSWRSFDDGEV